MTGLIWDMRKPTEWAEVPPLFSHTSLEAILDCPRRWQMLHSRWGANGDFPVPGSAKAIEGQIVHDCLDRLAKAVGLRGRPPIGTPEFQLALANCRLWEYLDSRVETLLTEHSTGERRLCLAEPRDLANRVIRLFRSSYRPGNGSFRDRGAKSELPRESVSWQKLLLFRGDVCEARLQHPTLPVVGVVDLVSLEDGGEIIVVDYKTGRRDASHSRQVLLYSLLWWRKTGDLPSEAIVQYLDRQERITVDADVLLASEKELEARVQAVQQSLSNHPASPTTSSNCSFCPLRALCDEGWQVAESLAGTGSDVELTVDSALSETGFAAKGVSGQDLHVTCEPALGRCLSNCVIPGDVLRLISAVQQKSSATIPEIEIRPSTRIFRVGNRLSMELTIPNYRQHSPSTFGSTKS